MFDFKDDRIMITGAAGGIGLGLVAYFLETGAMVFAVDRDAEGLDKLNIDYGVDARLHTAVVDLTDAESIMTATHIFADIYGPVTILINNAGAAAATSLATLKPQDWAHDLAINLSSAYHCVEAVKGEMIKAKKGVIINIGTVNAMLALGHPAYSAAKSGLISYTKSLAIEYGPLGIRANIICPGTVRTPAWNARAALKPEIFSTLKKWYPLRDFPDPKDIAQAAAFLASDMARMITGVVLPVDSGLTAGNPVMAAELTLEAF